MLALPSLAKSGLLLSAILGTGCAEISPVAPAGEGSSETNGEGSGGSGGEAVVNDEGTLPPLSDECANPKLTAIVRDFRGCVGPQTESGLVVSCTSGHPDFQTYSGDLSGTPCCGEIVDATLSDGKPTHRASGPFVDGHHWQQTTSPDTFAQWYADVEGVNIRVDTTITLASKTPDDAYGCSSAKRCFVYDSEENSPPGFFPIDGRAFADESAGEDNLSHNFAFTTEIHTEFEYVGGEVFTFSGDDDVWVFVNERLAIDLGGLHPRRLGSVDLDKQANALGIDVGKTYKLDIFHAERHTRASNFRIETTIECIQDVPSPK